MLLLLLLQVTSSEDTAHLQPLQGLPGPRLPGSFGSKSFTVTDHLGPVTMSYWDKGVGQGGLPHYTSQARHLVSPGLGDLPVAQPATGGCTTGSHSSTQAWCRHVLLTAG
jgi:hypothetical protein